MDAEHLLARNHHPLAVARPLRSPSARARPAHPLLALRCAFLLLFFFSFPLSCLRCRRAAHRLRAIPSWPRGDPRASSLPPVCVASSGPGSAAAWRHPCSPGCRHPTHPLASPRKWRGSMHTICMLLTSRGQTGVPQLQIKFIPGRQVEIAIHEQHIRKNRLRGWNGALLRIRTSPAFLIR